MSKKRNLSSLDASESPNATPGLQNKRRRLRRLPNVFSKVLELPLSSDVDVSVEDQPDCFRFVAKADFLDDDDDGGGGLDVWAHMIEVHPGVTKVVVRIASVDVDVNVDDGLGLDIRRFRLPDYACLEAVEAVCGGGKLVVIVPKKSGGGGEGKWSLIYMLNHFHL